MLMQLHGTCLGFEALAVIVSGDADILSTYDSYDNASPLILTEDGQSGSAFFGSLPGDLLQAVQEKPLAMENHGRGTVNASPYTCFITFHLAWEQFGSNATAHTNGKQARCVTMRLRQLRRHNPSCSLQGWE